MSRIVLILILLAGLLVFGFLFYNFLQPQTISSPMHTQIVTAQTPVEPTLTPVNNLNIQNTVNDEMVPAPTSIKSQNAQISPDGIFELLLETETQLLNQMSYTISVREVATGNHHTVFTETISAQTSVTIPFNTWSADNKHFFITLQNGIEQKNLVFKASGELIAEAPYINVNSHFSEKEIPYLFNEMTGWASQNLLVIKTVKADGSESGPSYWFDITNKTFIQLSSQF